MPTRTQGTADEWIGLQTTWRAYDDQRQALLVALAVRYGPDWRIACRRADQHRLDRLANACRRVEARAYAWLARHSPRDWSSSVPIGHVMRDLSYADAVTSGQLAVVPPPAYGQTVDDARAFAWPVASDAGSAGIVAVLALALALTGSVAASAAFGAASHAWIVISYGVAVGLAVVLRRKAGI